MNQTVFNTLKSRLETMEHELRSDLQCKSAELNIDALDGWRGSDSRAEVLQAQRVTVELKTRTEQRLIRVQNALKAIEKGTYGKCRKCGGRISEERLQVQPEAFLCIHCAAG